MSSAVKSSDAGSGEPDAGPSVKKNDKPKQSEGLRDTIESILFAFVLAFLFRTYEAEAFVIPTGSMAPTLYGRHKETTCVGCGHRIVVGASQEVDPESGFLTGGVRLSGAVCGNCGYLNNTLDKELAFNGDRILVNKFPYEFGEPERWDVFVFKYPSDPQTNYIKRLVGLPGEKIRIRNGDLFKVEGDLEIPLRKPPFKQQAIQIPVYDDNQPARHLLEAGWPERFANMKSGGEPEIGRWGNTTEGWTLNTKNRSYTISKEQASADIWLRYRHYFPRVEDWKSVELNLPLTPRPQLVADFCEYNATLGSEPYMARLSSIDYGGYWVPDLAFDATLKIESVDPQSLITLEIGKGVKQYQCRISPETGDAKIFEIDQQLNGREVELASAKTPVRGPGTYKLCYTNFDCRIGLWVNGKWIEFGEGALLDNGGAVSDPYPTNDDLTPAALQATGMAATVSNLAIHRDLYYRITLPEANLMNYTSQLEQYLESPQDWSEAYARFSNYLSERTFDLASDHFLAFGDNSPQSNDSRLWRADLSTVDRKLLVGKAFWIYWPHGVPFMNDGRGYPMTYHHQINERGGKETVRDYPRYTLPFRPQFERMNRIR